MTPELHRGFTVNPETEKTHKPCGGRSVNIIARIRDNATGVVRDDVTSSPFYDDKNTPDIFWWKEGNASCDCNRKQFFAQAGDEYEELDDDEYDSLHPCGNGGFSVNLINSVDGVCYYREFGQDQEFETV